jgi:fimbrial chaperone protein
MALRFTLAVGLAAIAAMALQSPAAAASLQVGPTVIQLLGTERTATVTVRNLADTEAMVQVRTVDWTQSNGQDVYAPSTTLLASPPLIKLAAGEAQVVRLVVEGTPSILSERAYRLIFDELPDNAAVQGAGVKTSLRVTAPVFLSKAVKASPEVRWTATRAPGAVILTAHNAGSARERLMAVKTSIGAGGGALEGYVLSGASRSWTLRNPPADASQVRVSGEGNAGAFDTIVPLSP